MKICRIAIDMANNMSAIGTKWYEVDFDEMGNEAGREYIPGTTRLWMDQSARVRNSAVTPSVILYSSENDGLDRDHYGWEAVDMLRNPGIEVTPRSNIKYRYFVKRNRFGDNAEDFKHMMRYLMGCISFAPGEEPDAYEISISYPVICQDADKGALKALISKVWYELRKPQKLVDLEMIDEAECALRFALKDKTIASQLGKQLSEKQEQLVLVIDIGGSTMELCLYRFYAQDGKGIYERLRILRADDEAGRGMGSHQVDEALRDELNTRGVLIPGRLNSIKEDLLMLRYFTPLKKDINEKLKAGKEARLDIIHAICDPAGMRLHNRVDKEIFEEWCKGYTAAVCEQIEMLCEGAGRTTRQIGTVILTGGGCELYPVEKEIRTLLMENTPVLRPMDPAGVLDLRIQDKDHADYIDGLCPRSEVASLACVLGNLAGQTVLVVPPPKPKSISKPYEPPVPPVSVDVKRYEVHKAKKKESYCNDCMINWFDTYKKCDNYCTCDEVCNCDSVCVEYSCAADCHCDKYCRDCRDCRDCGDCGMWCYDIV